MDEPTTSAMQVRPVPLDKTLKRLRDQTLSPGHPGRPVVWPYDDDKAKHYGCFYLSTITGCVSICPGVMGDSDPETSYRFHSMGVYKRWRGLGVGWMLLHHTVNEVNRLGGQLLCATARESAVGFYLHCGMTLGEYFIVEETGAQMRYVFLDRAGISRIAAQHALPTGG